MMEEGVMRSCLMTIGLCVLTHFISAQELRMEDPIPLEKKVQVTTLSNGVKTYVQSNPLPANCCSLRVVLKTETHEEEQFSFEGSLDSEEKLDHFFTFCKKKISNTLTKREKFSDSCAFSCSDLPLSSPPQEMAVIAVGDFDAAMMQSRIAAHFDNCTLSKNKEGSESSIRIAKNENISKGILNLFYPNKSHLIVSYQDLKESWKYLLLQELFQQRMEYGLRGMEEAWVHPYRRFFHPVSGYAFVSEDKMENLLSFLLWQAEAIRNNGFFEDEFYVTKTKLVNQLQYLSFNATEPDDSFLASYYADQFLLGEQCLDSQCFLEASASLVQEMQSEEIFPCLEPFFLDSNRYIQVVYPDPAHAELLTKEGVEEIISRVQSLSSFYRDSDIDEDSAWTLDTRDEDFFEEKNPVRAQENAAVIPCANTSQAPSFRLADNIIQVNNSSPESFFNLPLDDKEKRFIHSIISTIADKNLVQLVFERGNLEKKGKKINQVHPLRFMGYILSQHDLKERARIIKKSSFKWDAFIDGFAKRMKEELAKNNVYQHIPGFALQVGSTPEHINPFIHKKDFEGLVRSLL
jgi:hypothetical protein